MNNNQIKQRLIEAALTDEVPAAPQFEFPHQERSRRIPRWAGYAAAACFAAAIALPIALRQPSTNQFTASSLAEEEATLELEEAFAMIDRHFSSSNDLISMIQ